MAKSNLPIKGISSINNISIINLEGSGMVGKAGFAGRLFHLLSREQINMVLITQSSSEHSISFAVDPIDAVKAQQLIKQEFELELGAKKLIEKHKPAIVVEIFDENIVKINDLMKSYNYTNKGLIPKKYISQDYLFTYNNS